MYVCMYIQHIFLAKTSCLIVVTIPLMVETVDRFQISQVNQLVSSCIFLGVHPG